MEKKTAEEILSEITGIPVYRMKDDKGEYVTKSLALKAMEEYASQSHSSMQESIRELTEALETIADELDLLEVSVDSLEFKLWKIANDALKKHKG